MDLHINLFMEDDSKEMARVKEAQAKKTASQYEPTWYEVWFTGWKTHTGKHKKGIFQSKMTDVDKKKLIEVKQAIELGELGTGVESLKKFSKAHALNLHKQLQELRKQKIIEQYISNMPDNYITINTPDGLDAVVTMLKSEDLIALDTETTGVDYGHDVTVGISMSFPANDMHVYIPYGHTPKHKQLPKEYVIKTLKPHLERKGMRLVLHNSKFDAHMLAKDGINIVDNIWFDTMVCMAILNENDDAGLKAIATKYGKYFGFEDKSLSFEELFGKSPEAFYNNDSMDICTYYACKDTHLTLSLYKWQMEMLNKHPKLKEVYFGIEQPLTPAVIEMEATGFTIDFEYAKEYKEELKQTVKDLEDNIKDRLGDVNINSPSQLQKLFYDDMGLPDVSGKRSVDAKTLKALTKYNEDINLLLEYRDINKLLSTYVEPLPKKVRPDTKRLHSNFNQSATVTGRFASNNPNLQNLPPKARKLIVAPEGYLILGIDYSQIEPRTLAHMSGDKGLQEPYIKGIDLYATLASKIFKLSYEACLESDDETWRKVGLPKHPRKMMKVGLLAVMYGITIPSLAESLGISIQEADKFIKDFYQEYPVMAEWMKEQVAKADTLGYVETLHGRKRRFIRHPIIAKQYHALHRKVVNILGREPENIWDEPLPKDLKKQYWAVSKEYSRVARQAVNAVIQGSASEVLKKAMVAVHKYLKSKGDDWRLLATIHDELLYLVPDTVTPEEIAEIENIMRSVVKFDVPIKVDTEVSIRWGEGIPKDEWIKRGMGRDAFRKTT